MRYHKHLQAERLRRMPWTTQVGMIASELSRAFHLAQHNDAASEVTGCLERARELLGVLESTPIIPPQSATVLLETSRVLESSKLKQAVYQTENLYAQLMKLYRG